MIKGQLITQSNYFVLHLIILITQFTYLFISTETQFTKRYTLSLFEQRSSIKQTFSANFELLHGFLDERISIEKLSYSDCLIINLNLNLAKQGTMKYAPILIPTNILLLKNCSSNVVQNISFWNSQSYSEAYREGLQVFPTVLFSGLKKYFWRKFPFIYSFHKGETANVYENCKPNCLLIFQENWFIFMMKMCFGSVQYVAFMFSLFDITW